MGGVLFGLQRMQDSKGQQENKPWRIQFTKAPTRLLYQTEIPFVNYFYEIRNKICVMYERQMYLLCTIPS